MGAFGSLVNDVWQGSGLEPRRRQRVMDGGQEREWYRTMNGGIGGEGNRVRVPVF